jgi:hypothetical protein
MKGTYMITDILIWTVLIAMAVLLFVAIACDWMPHGGGSGAALTAFHDLQPKDKQRAVEMIIQEKAGKQKDIQQSGQGDVVSNDGMEKEHELQ